MKLKHSSHVKDFDTDLILKFPAAWSLLIPTYSDGQLRLGGANDGGYVANKNSIIDSEALISFGLSKNINFEYDFFKLNSEIDLKIYDYSVNPSKVQSIIVDMLKAIYLRNYSLLKHYMNFYRKFYFLNYKQKVFICKRVTRDSDSDGNVSIEKILFDIKKNRIFLKMDIESDEYLLLDYLAKNKDRFNSLIIEFHQVNLFQSQIIKFAEELSSCFFVEFININNYGGIEQNIPKVIEVTFTHRRFFSQINQGEITKDLINYRNSLTRRNIVFHLEK